MDLLELKSTLSEIKNSWHGVTADWTLKKVSKSFYKPPHQYYVLNIQRELNVSQL